jgi:oligopeptide/dipeptide ABC transporter ATP-binding protein
MYLGRVVETGSTAAIFDRPEHPYTRALLSAVPSRDRARRQLAVTGEPVVWGEPKAGGSGAGGCAFLPRCAEAAPQCAEQIPPLTQIRPGHLASCLMR